MVNTEEAKQMQNGINIQGKIRDKGEIRTVNRKKDGAEVKVCDAYLADAVGSIKLTLWAEDTERVKDGMEVSIEGGYITSWKEVKQLNIPQPPKGKLEVISDDNCKDDDDDPAMTDNYTDEEVKEIQLRKYQRDQTYDGMDRGWR